MQDKQKVTLYLPPELHRKLKIRAAVDGEPMSALAERALMFYLENPEAVEEAVAVQGRNHRVYHCPDCATPSVVRDGELVAISQADSIIEDDVPSELPIGSSVDRAGEGNLVTC